MSHASTSNPAQQGDWDSTSDSKGDAKLLDRIRTRYRYMEKAWRNVRDRGHLDMQALGPDGPWDPQERAARKEAKRPCIHLDQLNQYPNTLVNQVRQNPLATKVTPMGYGANDKTATLRGDRIRAIETECDAPRAYLTALLCAAQRGFGVFTMETEEIDWDGFDQRIVVVREPNPDAVLWDPDCRKADSSDMQDAFKIWRIPIADFKRDWPDAQVTDFNLEHQSTAPEWVNIEKQTVQLAKYSYIEKTSRYLYLLDDGTPKGKKVFKDELPKGAKAKAGQMTFADGRTQEILKEKKATQQQVKRCVTNGIEILSEVDWAGKYIPVFPMLGAEKYVKTETVTGLGTSGVVELVLESYIRNAIDGQKAFDSAKTNEVEAANMVPKIVYLGYEGQFDTATDWKNINKLPTVYAEIALVSDPATGATLPLPQRVPYDPPVQSMELLADGALRSIQAAIGSHGFLKQDDTNVKSGKAVALLKSQSDVGSYHFIDNYMATIRHAGRAMNDLLDKIEDTPRDVGLHKADGTQEIVHINEPYKDKKTGQMVEHRYTPRDPQTNEPSTDANHDVIVDAGPSYESERDQARDFVQSLVATPAGQLVLDLLVKWSMTGPFADEIAERLTPPQFQKHEGQPDLPPQVKQQMAQLQQQNQQLTEELQRANQEREAETAKTQGKLQIEQLSKKMEMAIQQMKDATSLAVAAINQKGQLLITHEELTSEENLALAAQGHEIAMASAGSKVGAAAADQAAAQAATASAQDHGQALEQQDQQSQAALDQQQQAADLAPPSPGPAQ